jgi:hypothetical protein
MNIKSRVEGLEAKIPCTVAATSCLNCEGLRRALGREYGGSFPAIVHTPEACAELYRNLEKAYEG